MNRIVSREEWNVERAALLEAEKDMTRRRDAMNRRRSELPWVKIDKDYRFTGPRGEVSLADLFAGRSQLIDRAPLGRQEEDLPWPMAWSGRR